MAPGAREEDIVRVEEQVGARLPDLLRERLLAENGGVLDDSAGITGRSWRLLPVLDRSHRKRMTATAQDIGRTTTAARAAEGKVVRGPGGPAAERPFPPDGVVIALGIDARDWLVLLPDPQGPGTLGTALHRQRNLFPIAPLGVDLAAFAPDPAPSAADEPLPDFRYHPDPVATGAIDRTVLPCAACGRARGWRLTTAGGGSEGEVLCPWCLDADVREHRGLVVDVDAEASDASAQVVVRRTPGFPTWQDTRWMAHCGEAAAYRGTGGWEDVEPLPAARASILADGWDPSVLVHLRRDGDLVAYLFRCVRCGEDLAYADAS